LITAEMSHLNAVYIKSSVCSGRVQAGTLLHRISSSHCNTNVPRQNTVISRQLASRSQEEQRADCRTATKRSRACSYKHRHGCVGTRQQLNDYPRS